jgi:DcaP outer membrane protein
VTVSTKPLFLAFLSLLILAHAPAHAEKAQKKTSLLSFSYDDFAIRLGGRIKLDAFYDCDAQGGVYGLDPSTLPLKGINSAAEKKGHFNVGVVASRLSVDVKRDFESVKTHAFFELDFSKDSSQTTDNPSPRIRHAYVTFDVTECDSFLIGQTWFRFQDLNAFAMTLDNLYGGFWQPQVRYTRKLGKSGMSLSAALAQPDTQYIDSTNTLSDNTGFGQSKLPDFEAQLTWDHSRGHLTVSGLARRLQAKVNRADGALVPLHKSALGWGIGFSGRQKIYKESSIFWQVNGGKGLDRYIDDASNQDLFVQFPVTGSESLLTRVAAIPAINYIFGVEIWYTDRLFSNIAASITKLRSIKGMTRNSTVSFTNYNRLQQRYHVNLIYKLFSNTNIGIEAMHYRRTAGAPTTYRGKDTRILVSFSYTVS